MKNFFRGIMQGILIILMPLLFITGCSIEYSHAETGQTMMSNSITFNKNTET